jgi:hypothetical protein
LPDRYLLSTYVDSNSSACRAEPAWLKDGKACRYTTTASREEYSARLVGEALVGGGDTEVRPAAGVGPLARQFLEQAAAAARPV